MAVEHAERRGLRLPDVVECEFLATVNNTQSFPWGHGLPTDAFSAFDQPVGSVKDDKLERDPSIRGLSSGVLEWTMTRDLSGPIGDGGPGLRYIVRGGPLRLINEYLVLDKLKHQGSVAQHVYRAGTGVRCARSPGPRLKPGDFLTPLHLRSARRPGEKGRDT
jgi:hypothetical protein